MVAIRKLTPEEATRAFPLRRQQDLSEYLTALRQLRPGESAEAALDGLSSRALKRRFSQAAAQLGFRLKWARTPSQSGVYVQVLPGRTPPSSAARRPGAAGRRSRGRAPSSDGMAEAGGVPAAYCMKCRTQREMQSPRQITMKNGRPATEGQCPVCGTRLFKIGKRG